MTIKHVPQQVLVIDIYGSGFAVLIDSRCGDEKVWFSQSGKACVPNRSRVNGIIEKLKSEKNPDIAVVEHYFDGHRNYLPPTVEDRRIV